jgi:hypothetical protein
MRFADFFRGGPIGDIDGAQKRILAEELVRECLGQSLGLFGVANSLVIDRGLNEPRRTVRQHQLSGTSISSPEPFSAF